MGNLELALAGERARYETTATLRAKRDSVRANIDPGGRLKDQLVPTRPLLWYVLQTWPGMEMRATNGLAIRRFGAYLPMVLALRGGRRVSEPMFREYVLVLASDIEAHWGRLRVVPGVKEIVRDGPSAAVLPDDWVECVQRYELGFMVANGQVELFRKRERWRRGPRRRGRGPQDCPQEESDEEVLAKGVHIVSMSSKSHWRDEVSDDDGQIEVPRREIEEVDSRSRVTLLHKALGLSGVATLPQSNAVPHASV